MSAPPRGRMIKDCPCRRTTVPVTPWLATAATGSFVDANPALCDVVPGEAADMDAVAVAGAGCFVGAATVGIAGWSVVTDRVCGLAQAVALLHFFARESARQCGACTFGTPAMAQALARLAAGQPAPFDQERLRRYAEVILPGRGACGHLDGATNAARTALHVFASEIAVHTQHGTCDRPQAVVCRDWRMLMSALEPSDVSPRGVRLRVNPIPCAAFGYRAEYAPELFGLDEWGYPIVYRQGLSPEQEALARAAARRCPVRTILLEQRGPARRRCSSPHSVSRGRRRRGRRTRLWAPRACRGTCIRGDLRAP
jgi:ferredoxin